ncbi:MAG: mechanosensitive ion channel [Betaproteobacteria bacterium]|nr:mechanosensitive ion channel [Betaproteobacteria bacterium]
MNASAGNLGILRDLESRDFALVVVVLVIAWLLASAVRWLLHRAAERAPMRMRLPVLRTIPILRLCIGIGAFVVIVPILVEPSLQNVVAIVASVGLALAFALKDYASSLVAGLVTVIEGPYQPGDWIEVGGTYGEVKLIGLRAVHVVTAYDNEVIIPHSRLWSASISNATSGSHSVLCVADFYLEPDHDAQRARQCLAEVGVTSAYRRPETEVSVVVREKPWGTHYKLKAYVNESREQFEFVTDLTIRGKEALRALNIRFARAPYAKVGRS